MASSLQFGSSWATACFVESSKNNKLDWKRTLQPKVGLLKLNYCWMVS